MYDGAQQIVHIRFALLRAWLRVRGVRLIGQPDEQVRDRVRNKIRIRPID